MELGQLLQAKVRMQNQTKFNINNKKQKLDKKKIESKLEEKNKSKLKSQPKEFSALIKPKFKAPKVENIKDKFKGRDPRFDNLSGELKLEHYNKNFSFVEEEAKNYISKIKQI
jgi:hypothetical protein